MTTALRFDRVRVRETVDEMTDDEVDLFYSGSWVGSRVLSVDEKRDEMRDLWEDELGPLELADVLDEEGTLRYRIVFFTGGSALAYDAATSTVVAAAAQHGLDRCVSRALWEALGAAYAASSPKIRQTIDFTVQGDADSRFGAI